MVGGSWPCTYPAGLAAGSSSRYDQVAACEVMPSSAYRKLLEALTLTLTLTLTRTLSLSLTLTLSSYRPSPNPSPNLTVVGRRTTGVSVRLYGQHYRNMRSQAHGRRPVGVWHA